MPAPRQRQSRLSFTPLPSSSPAAKGYNKQIQNRAAAVTIQGSAKRRILHDREEDEDAESQGLSGSLPTPAATLERDNGERVHGSNLPEEEENDSDGIPLAPTQRLGTQRKRRTRQQQIEFSNTRDADSFDSRVKLPSSSAARAQTSTNPGLFGTQRKRAAVVCSDESEDELPSPAKLVAKKNKRLKKSKRVEEDRPRMTRSTRRSSEVAPESEEEDITVSSSKQLPLEVESEDDEDDMPTTTATQRRKRTRKQASPDSFISSSPPPGPIDSDDDLVIIERPTKRRRKRRGDSESEDEDDEPVTPGRRMLKGPRKINQQEAADLAEDLDFLGPSSDVEDSTRKPRNTQTRKEEARLSALEKLKRKRSIQSSQPQAIVVDGDGEEDEEQSEPESSIDAGEGDDSDVEEIEQHAPMSSRQYFTANKEDDAFIESGEEDGDGTLGFPDHSVPIEFTKYARMKPKELFPYAVEWMVQKKINPAFSRDDELYALTFRKLNDEVKGLAGSKFTSSAWTEQFTFALRARPDIAYEELDRSGEHFINDHCDACNRTGHPATYQIQFQGKPYHLETLEKVNNDANEDGDSDSGSSSSSDNGDGDDEPSYDADGHQIVPVTKVFYVGRFCQANALTAHALQHWKYHLNAWVVNWLNSHGYLRPTEIVKRDEWSERKRRRCAEKISDRMEKEGVVQTLWREFRGNIDEARDAKQGGRF